MKPLEAGPWVSLPFFPLSFWTELQRESLHSSPSSGKMDVKNKVNSLKSKKARPYKTHLTAHWGSDAGDFRELVEVSGSMLLSTVGLTAVHPWWLIQGSKRLKVSCGWTPQHCSNILGGR